MNIVLFTHPVFLNSASMPRFAQAIVEGMSERGHTVHVWSPAPFLYRLPVPVKLSKWLGYFDQYVLFPIVMRWRLLSVPNITLFVFADQALGPWVPLVAHRPHVIHCHDLLALRSALGEVPENPTGFTGVLYQRFIRWGFSKGKNFISVSDKTRTDLHRLAQLDAERSVVVYNGLNYPYCPMPLAERSNVLRLAGLPVEPRGMLLHVGGGQWYKNWRGVVELYAAYATAVDDPLPLWMVGPKNQAEINEALALVPPQGKVHFFCNLDANALHAAYAHAALFLFPSLDEGFGWPIAEAQACGTPVLTTDAAPMTEVGGDAAFYHARRTAANVQAWAVEGAKKIHAILTLDAAARAAVVARGLVNAARFDPAKTFAGYAAVYEQVLNGRGANV